MFDVVNAGYLIINYMKLFNYVYDNILFIIMFTMIWWCGVWIDLHYFVVGDATHCNFASDSISSA